MARTRGSMKHPYRIRQSGRPKEATDAQIDAILGDDFGAKKKKCLPAPVVKNNRTGQAQVLQNQKFLQKIRDAAATKTLEKEEEQRYEDPWANQEQTAKPVKKSLFEIGSVASSVHSAYSYNPDKTILEHAQQQVAAEYLQEQIADVQARLQQSRAITYKDYREMSLRAFKALAGQYEEAPVNIEFKAIQDAARKELEELQDLQSKIQAGQGSQMDVDFFVNEQKRLEAKKQDIEAQFNELNALFEEEKNKLEELIANNPTLNSDRLRANAFESVFIYILQEMSTLRKLLGLYKGKTSIYNDKVIDYQLPLEKEIGQTLRQAIPKTPLEELFLKMKRDGKFDEENPIIKFDKILRVKTTIKLARGAMNKYADLNQ